MKQLKLILSLVAICLLTSCNSIENFRKPLRETTDPVFCPSNAFIDLKQYEINGPQDSKDFHERYVPELATKYPPLKDAYALLYECWEHYHPTMIKEQTK